MKRKYNGGTKVTEGVMEPWMRTVQDMWFGGKTEDHIVSVMEMLFCDVPEFEVRQYIQDLRDGQTR